MKGFSALVVSLTLCVSAFSAFAGAKECQSEEAALWIAREAVADRENWPHGGDYNVSSDPEGWRVTAWRIDFPKHEGSARYAGNGFRVIHIGVDGTLRRYSRQ